jgi:hypothetical protein
MLFARSFPSWMSARLLVALGILGTAIILGLAFGLIGAFHPLERQPGIDQWPDPVSPQRPGGLPPANYPVDPLLAGDKAPPLEALGWLNGPCPALEAEGPKVIVVDLWAFW